MRAFIVAIFLIESSALLCQDSGAPKFMVDLGYSFRSTAFEGLVGVPTLPMNYERNLQGSVGKIGLEYRLFKKLGVSYSFGLKYDHVRYGDQPSINDEARDWLIDHSLGIKIYPVAAKENSTYLLGEVGLLNANSGFYYFNGSESVFHDLSFYTINIGMSFRVWRLMVQPKLSFAEFGNPYNGIQRFMFGNLDLFYRLTIR